MYLKKVPIIDLNNEMLLKIVFSMMLFTKSEIEELKQAREELPIYKIDTAKTKKVARNQGSSKRNLSSQHSNQSQSSFSKNMPKSQKSPVSSNHEGTVGSIGTNEQHLSQKDIRTAAG